MKLNFTIPLNRKQANIQKIALKSCLLLGSVELFLADAEKRERSKQYAEDHQSSKRDNMSEGRKTEEDSSRISAGHLRRRGTWQWIRESDVFLVEAPP